MRNSPQGRSRTTKPMKLLLALLAGLALALYVLLLADGPSLLDIINRF